MPAAVSAAGAGGHITMKAFLNFFLSIKTAFGFFLFFVAVMLYGSLSLPNNLAFFSGIDDAPLFRWLAEAKGFGTTWWIHAMILGFALFAVNTLVCTGDVLLFRLGRRAFVAKLSPQVMHIGVLFAMLGHLLTASLGVKLDIDLRKGETKAVSATAALALEDVRVREDTNGYAVDWEVVVRWIEDGKRSGALGLRPVHPLYFGSYGVYTKSVNTDKDGASALIRVSRDPGAPWALLGGALLCIGGAGFLYGRFGSRAASRD